MPNKPIKIRFFVVDFASHRSWVEGLQKALARQNHTPIHVKVQMIPATRWKWRMLVASAELEVADDDDIVFVDGMLDVSPLVALLRGSQEARLSSPVVLVYMHENQLCTPFTQQDRDLRRQTHWHYGIAHWRSLLVSDGFIFNSQTQLDSFATALPKLINEQCPRDTVDWHLDKAAHLLQTKCTVLHNGLELQDLRLFLADECNADMKPGQDPRPTILWNARLEEDKDPAMFIRILNNVRNSGQEFRLIVLGEDYTKDATWESQIKHEFAAELLFFGWCSDRREYARWLQQATVVLSTAKHETFGSSIVESAVCGALPLLPNRLSYPELFNPNEYPFNFYSDSSDCVTKLATLLNMEKEEQSALCASIQESMMRFDWTTMVTKYSEFFTSIANGDDIPTAGRIAAGNDEPLPPVVKSSCDDFIEVSDADDPRVVLYRPKSRRDNNTYQHELISLRSKGIEPSLHGGRRATMRLLDAISSGSSSVQLLSVLTTSALAHEIFVGDRGERQTTVPVYIADKSLIDTIRGIKLNTADAVLTSVHFPIASTLEELLAHPPILVLEDVRNGENTGSILRTAFCLGIKSIVASSSSWAAIKDTRAARCSMGTIYYQKIHRTTNLGDTLIDIRRHGCRVYGVEIGPNAVPIHPHGRDRNWAMVLGNEDAGLSASVQSSCDEIVFIPQMHGDSLNVGHAASVAMFELGREGPLPAHDGRGTCT